MIIVLTLSLLQVVRVAYVRCRSTIGINCLGLARLKIRGSIKQLKNRASIRVSFRVSIRLSAI